MAAQDTRLGGTLGGGAWFVIRADRHPAKPPRFIAHQDARAATFNGRIDLAHAASRDTKGNGSVVDLDAEFTPRPA